MNQPDPYIVKSARTANRGAALVITLAIIVLVTFLVVALFTTVSSERVESAAAANRGDVEQLTAATVDLVKATITQATAGYESNDTTGALDTANRTAWASQPGLIRTWSQDGDPYKSFRLYSGGNLETSTIAVDGSLDVAEDAPPAGWKTAGTTYNALWSDLNAPAPSGTNPAILNYPIVTPPKDANSGSVATDADNGVPTDDPATATQEGVQGFAVTDTLGFLPGTAPGPTNNPAPMPVKWLYVLKDGRFVSPTGTGAVATVDGATKDNPIVGRIAYWTDDETCKVNINTASEGVYWDKPYGKNPEESGISAASPTLGYSMSVPSTDEFQRLPGHPAFTSLSAILGGVNWLPRPDIGFSASGSSGAATYTGGTFDNNIMPYYNLVPRIGGGGTKGGTRYILDPSISGNPIQLDADRLYATPNEFLYNNNRTINNSALTPDKIKQTQFFLTSASKAPETTLLEQPRVSMWPLQQSASARNAKDRLLAFSAAIKGSSGSYPYYFQRVSQWVDDNNPGSSQSVSTDISLDRNLKLLSYLNQAAKTKAPGFGDSLSAKYSGAKLGQILLQMFDSTRSLINTTSRSLKEAGLTAGYSYAPYASTGGDAIGVGTVVPAVASLDGAGNIASGGPTRIKGFGRWPVVSEVVIVFMATEWADNTCLPDASDPVDWADRKHTPDYAADPAGTPRRYPDWVPHWGDAAKTPIAYLPSYAASAGLDVLIPAPAGAKGDDLPDDMPQGSDPGPATPLFATDAKGRITTLNGSWSFNGIGDPQTTQVQAFILISFMNPSPGQPELAPAVRYQIEGLDSLTLNAKPLGFPAADDAVLLIRNNQIRHPFPEGNNELQLTSGKDVVRTPGPSNGKTSSSSKDDPKNKLFPFISQKVSIDPAAQPGQWGLEREAEISTLFKYSLLRPSLTPSTMAFSGGNITIKVFPGVGNDFPDDTCIQTLHINMPQASLPVPLIIRPVFEHSTDEAKVLGANWPTSDFKSWARPDDKNTPIFYSGLSGSAGAKADGRFFSSGTGRMDRIDISTLILGANTPGSFIRRGDVVRSMVLDPLGPAKGDIRLLAGLADVPTSFFAPSGGNDTYKNSTLLQATGATYRSGNQNERNSLIYGNIPTTLTNPHAWAPVNRRPIDEALGRLVDVKYLAGTSNIDSNRPLVPRAVGPSVAPDDVSDKPIATRGKTENPGDWNTGVGAFYDGPYINSGEQGYLNAEIGTYNSNMYFPSNTGNATSSGAVSSFSPNRQVSSPVLFGSLPSGIDPSSPENSLPWQTLLFCPNPADRNNHPGFGSSSTDSGPDARGPFSVVPDHLFIDLLWMPVVEPYAISEPFATAGKINLNYQMAPFTHIERSTGLYAALKALKMPAISDAEAADYKDGFAGVGAGASEKNNPSWRYNIDVPAVLAGMKDRRFSQNDIYRSASEVTTIFMVPSRQPGSPNSPAGPSGATGLQRYNNTASWWDDKQLSGDNLRESPYDHLYSRITTKSNTFTVHYRVQALKQTGAAGWDKWDEAKDVVLSESRGSETIERYVDPNDTSIPDFADPANYSKNLAPYYRWRTLASKQFVP